MLTIGVSGHRPGVKYAARSAVKRDLKAYFEALARPFRLISALAEGADRDAAEAALAAGGSLIALTPFDHAEYCRDFAGRASIVAFRRLLARADAVETLRAAAAPLSARRAAYAVAGFAMLDRSDRLLAVWNGGHGGYGGVSTIVAEAKRRGLAIDWLHAMRPGPPRRWRDGRWGAAP